jgi:hypothetical protein
MRNAQRLQRLTCVGALMFSLTLAWTAIAPPPVQATARQRDASGDTVTMALTNGTSFTYKGSPSPRFQVTVTLGQPMTVNQVVTVVVQLENGQSFSGNLPGPASALSLQFLGRVRCC